MLSVPIFAQEALWNELNSRGFALFQQGKYSEAEDLFKQALSILEKAPEPDHSYMAVVLENLVKMYKKTGRDKEAKEMEERIEKIGLEDY